MIIWNPWHGCHKVSEGCLHCYMYFLDGKRGIDTSRIFRTENFTLPVQKNRAGQFAPFAALTGHSAAIEETARLTDSQVELADEDSEILNQKMAFLRENLGEHPDVVITYFEPDKKKAGGAYKTVEGQLQNIDDYNQCLVLRDGKAIFFQTVLDIQY